MSLADIIVVLVRTEGALNLGSVARLCGNFGCRLSLVAPVADRGTREAVMMAHPAEALLASAPLFATLGEALQGVELSVGTSTKIVEARDGPAFDVERARLLLPSPGQTLALVLGPERTGLSLDEAACCTRLVRLHTPGAHESLNVSHACASLLTVLSLAVRAQRPEQRETRAAPGERERLVQEWLAALDAAHFFKAQTPEGFAPRLKEIVDKMDVSARDVEILRSMMRVFTKHQGAAS
jgi:tRNA/rRNA methyltransferase